MESIYWNTDGDKATTNISYNCVDRHLMKDGYKHDIAMLWDGNFWDDDVHDYADLSWDVVDVLTRKIANIFKGFCGKARKLGKTGSHPSLDFLEIKKNDQQGENDRILFLLHNVIQLPISIMAASRIGAVSVPLNPAESTTSQLIEVIQEIQPVLVVTVDAFWQGHKLIEIKKELDIAVQKLQTTSVKRILVIRHTAPNDGVPPPDEFELNKEIETEWRDLVAKADISCDPVWTPKLQLRTISTKQALIAAEQLAPLTVSDCLSLAHPQTALGLIGFVAIWFSGKTLAIYEGPLDHPDPSRLKQVIRKFELKSAIIPTCDLEPEYMAIVQVPTLTRIVTEHEDTALIQKCFPDIEVLQCNVKTSLE
ncbi:unnamed protein product [Nippostrongylus brasiliensis]|uniref:acetate--CoA ligase n=1 Tax=Nippostrongylus brasiliensis TaxID=27835 RepID=A0A0N4XX35_NIPBR|nr:unnamed protein product [Nippostrongylus brasiliensis]